MKVEGVSTAESSDGVSSRPVTPGGSVAFDRLLASQAGAAPPAAAAASQSAGNTASAGIFQPPRVVRTGLNSTQAAAAYAKQSAQVPVNSSKSGGAPASEPSGFAKYKEDQLLRYHGGKGYDLDKKQVPADGKQKTGFLQRVGKDLGDAFGNVKNSFGNLLMGAKTFYRDKNGTIREERQRGLLGVAKDFVSHMGTALTFGAWCPGSRPPPQGFVNRLMYAGSNLKEAISGDLMTGIGQSVNHMTTNLVLAGWNLTEVVPDATVGNFDAGAKLTNTIFDNGQVAVQYLTDIVPTGDAWLRVHASDLRHLKLPLLYNLKMPENYGDDTRWKTVRNTTFRKSVETVGALLADAAAIGFLGQASFSSNKRNPIE